MDYDKPWMRPIQYNDERASQAPEVQLEAEQSEEGLANFPRVEGNRDAVKPKAVKDTSPLRYRRGDPNEVFGEFDERDEILDNDDDAAEESA